MTLVNFGIISNCRLKNGFVYVQVQTLFMNQMGSILQITFLSNSCTRFFSFQKTFQKLQPPWSEYSTSFFRSLNLSTHSVLWNSWQTYFTALASALALLSSCVQVRTKVMPLCYCKRHQLRDDIFLFPSHYFINSSVSTGFIHQLSSPPLCASFCVLLKKWGSEGIQCHQANCLDHLAPY